MKQLTKKAEVEIKDILIGLMFVVLVAGLFSVMVNSFKTQYSTDLGEAETFLNTIGANSTEYQEIVADYNSTLFAEQEASIVDWVDFMWRGTWKVLKKTVTLPTKVYGVAQATLFYLGFPTEVAGPILVFILSILTLIVIFAIIYKLKGVS